MAGRKKKYTAKSLSEAVDKYFASISRTTVMTEKVPTEQRDDRGHIIYEYKAIINNLGEPLTVNEFVVPPTVGGLCEFLHIHRSTWADYCDTTKHPEFSDTTTHARGRMRAYLEQQLLTRKDVKGIIFDLQNNYGLSERREIELGERASKALSSTVSADEREELLKLLREEMEQDNVSEP